MSRWTANSREDYEAEAGMHTHTPPAPVGEFKVETPMARINLPALMADAERKGARRADDADTRTLHGPLSLSEVAERR